MNENRCPKCGRWRIVKLGVSLYRVKCDDWFDNYYTWFNYEIMYLAMCLAARYYP